MVVMRASMVEVYLTHEIMIKYHKRLCKGRTEKCILTSNLKLPKYLYKAVRSNRQFTYCSEIKKMFLFYLQWIWGEKIAHSTLFQIYVCPSLLSADAVQTYKDSSKVIPLLLRIRNHKLEPIFCQTETILEKKKKSPYLVFVFRAQNKPSWSKNKEWRLREKKKADFLTPLT